jgi:hypothetical protein
MRTETAQSIRLHLALKIPMAAQLLRDFFEITANPPRVKGGVKVRSSGKYFYIQVAGEWRTHDAHGQRCFLWHRRGKSNAWSLYVDDEFVGLFYQRDMAERALRAVVLHGAVYEPCANRPSLFQGPRWAPGGGGCWDYDTYTALHLGKGTLEQVNWRRVELSKSIRWSLLDGRASICYQEPTPADE